ncbi:hypothetical protein F5878DRAFT_498046, partial [Lentinula raphanica]
KILKDAISFFSTKLPGVSSVIPAMDAIDEAFVSGIVDEVTLPSPVRHALLMGKKTLNKVILLMYQLSDNSYIYRMAIVLHPSHKLEYFNSDNADWPQSWIDGAV